MKMVINYQGLSYESAEVEESADETADMLYDSIDKLDKFRLNMKDGGFAIFGKDALRNCVIVVLE